MIKVFGHLSPDTDATCSAIIWAWYLNTHTAEEATAYVLGSLNSETQFVLNHFKVQTPALLESVTEDDVVVIVDTNNPQELFSNIHETNIRTIIDHHKLVGGITTSVPIDITIRPLASTASVIYDLLGDHHNNLPRDIAGLLLSCVLSDTLAFRSPTTTPHDKDIAETLATYLGVDVHEYAQMLFEAKSDISSFTDAGLVKLDSKKFEVGTKNFRVSVIETTSPQTVLIRKEGIVAAIKEIIAEEGDIDDVLFFIVDILNEEATVLTYNDTITEVIEKSFKVKVSSDTEVLPGVVSRKKQILPSLTL